MKRKSILLLAIIFMSIGFASVSTVLYLNGQTDIASNISDFDVYFSKSYENGVENNALIKDKTHIAFSTELKKIDETYILDYEVTNASKQYDTNVTMNCTGGNEYIRVTNEFETNEVLPARTIRPGKLTLTVLQGVTKEVRVEISCEIQGNAQERTEAGGESFDKEMQLLVGGAKVLKEKMNLKNSTYQDGNIHEMFEFTHGETVQIPKVQKDYRYIGDDPYNYIYFNCSDYANQNENTCELWRIIGLIPDEDDVYRIKLIKDEASISSAWGTSSNAWNTSIIKNVAYQQVNEDTQNHYMDSVKYYLGGYTYYNGSADFYYSFERGNSKYNKPYLNSMETVGLMYPSDYGYTYGKGVSKACYDNLHACNGVGGWLYNKEYQWTISPLFYIGNNIFVIYTNGNMDRTAQPSDSFMGRPVVYLKPEIEFKKGDYDGSASKPYELVEMK